LTLQVKKEVTRPKNILMLSSLYKGLTLTLQFMQVKHLARNQYGRPFNGAELTALAMLLILKKISFLIKTGVLQALVILPSIYWIKEYLLKFACLVMFIPEQ